MNGDEPEERRQERKIVDRKLKPLREALLALEHRINPDSENLHFPAKLEVSAHDFETLGRIGTEGLEITQEYRDDFFEDPYLGGIWYEYMLLVSAAALSRLNHPRPAPVDEAILAQVLKVLFGICECMHQGGDSAKRCFEATGNLLLAFKNESLRKLVLDEVSRSKDERGIGDFLLNVMDRVKSVEARPSDRKQSNRDQEGGPDATGAQKGNRRSGPIS